MAATSYRLLSSHESQTFINTQILWCAAVVLEYWEFPNLAGPFWRWYCNENKGASIIVAERRIDLLPGMLYLIPPHTPFASYTRPGVRHLYMHFSVGLHYPASSPAIIEREISRDEMRIVNRMKEALKTDSDAVEISFHAQALANTALGAIPDGSWSDRRENSVIDDAIRNIRSGYPRVVDNRTLARSANMHVNAFTRIFKQSTGCSPHQFLINLRLQEALHLLNHTRLSIDNIAEKTGFCDRFHFSRMCRIHLKSSPGELRRGAQRDVIT